jgi:pilus assembly protein CpaE
VTFADLPIRLASGPADVVLVILRSSPTALLAVQQAVASQLLVLVVGSSAHSHLILQAIRNGATGYLEESHLREELLGTLEKWHGASSGMYRRGWALGVLAAAPGSGVTTVAASLAFALAEQAPRQITLAEVGAGVPSLALNLNLEPDYSIADLILQWERMDASMVRQVLIEHAAGVHVLGYKPETLQAVDSPPLAIRQVVLLLGSLFRFAVLDLGHKLDTPRLAALRLCKAIVLVVRLDVPALRLTRQLIRQLLDQGIPAEKLCLVANRYGQRKQISAREAGTVLNLPILGWIPDDPATLNQANNNGLPLVRTAPRAAITRTFDNLARRLHQPAA